MTFREVSGEDKSCFPEMTAPSKETHLSTILSRYQLKKIFDTEKFGLFSRCFHQNQCTSKINDVQEGSSVRYVQQV